MTEGTEVSEISQVTSLTGPSKADANNLRLKALQKSSYASMESDCPGLSIAA